MTIEGYCNEGLSPLPSGGVNARVTPAEASDSPENGLAMKLMRTEKNTPVAIVIETTKGMSWRFLRPLSSTASAL